MGQPYKEFIAGFLKPFIDFFQAIPAFFLSQLFLYTSTIMIASSQFHIQSLFDPLFYISIIGSVAIIEEIFLGFRFGYYKPFNAFCKIIGILLSVCCFWVFLVISYETIGVSQAKITISVATTLVAMVVGVTIRVMMTRRLE